MSGENKFLESGHIYIYIYIYIYYIYYIYILNSVRQHNYFITHYMFRLYIRHLQVYFCHLIHKTLCTIWDPIVFTSME